MTRASKPMIKVMSRDRLTAPFLDKLNSKSCTRFELMAHNNESAVDMIAANKAVATRTVTIGLVRFCNSTTKTLMLLGIDSPKCCANSPK